MQERKLKNRLMYGFISLFLSCFTITVFAVAAAQQTASQPKGTTQASSSSSSGTVEYCPDVSKLIRKGLWWGAPGSWRSYSTSLVKKISNFSGAQWVGVNVGVIICVYQGEGATDFPVSIQRSTILPMPKGGQWSNPDQDGRVNCYSNDVSDCPFVVPAQTKLSPKEAFQELQSFKAKKQPDDAKEK